MRQIASVLVVSLLCLSPALSGGKGVKTKKDKKDKEEKKEKKTLEGTWRILSVFVSGVKIDRGVDNAKVIISPDRLVMTGKGKGTTMMTKVNFEENFGPIDLTQNVPASRSGMPARVENLKGLFKMNEDDLTIVWGLPPARKGADGKLAFGDSVRPSSVNELKGNFQLILKREGGGKKKDKK